MSDNRRGYKQRRLRALRTGHRAPETNGVVDRFVGALNYEHLYRVESGDVLGLTARGRRLPPALAHLAAA